MVLHDIADDTKEPLIDGVPSLTLVLSKGVLD